MSGRRMSGTSRRFPRYFFELQFSLGNEGKDGPNLGSQTGLEVPDVLLPDVHDHPKYIFLEAIRFVSITKTRFI